MHESLVVLAAGMSSRMKKSQSVDGLDAAVVAQANKVSKGLITVGDGGRPLLDYILYNARSAGYQHIVLLTGKDNSAFKELYGDLSRGNSFRGLQIDYAVQHIPTGRSKPYGTADAVQQAVAQVDLLQNNAFTVCNCDNLYSETAFRLLRETPAANAWIAYDREALDFPAERIARFGVARSDEDGYLLEMIEKPSSETMKKCRDHSGALRVSMNIFKFDGAMFFPFLKNCPVTPERDEKELATAITNMIREVPKSMLGIPLAEHVPDLTEKRDIARMRQYLGELFGQLNW